jgi:hypothetical protein
MSDPMDLMQQRIQAQQTALQFYQSAAEVQLVTSLAEHGGGAPFSITNQEELVTHIIASQRLPGLLTGSTDLEKIVLFTDPIISNLLEPLQFKSKVVTKYEMQIRNKIYILHVSDAITPNALQPRIKVLSVLDLTALIENMIKPSKPINL